MAEVEIDRIHERTRKGLRAARQKGVRLARRAEDIGELADRAAVMRRGGTTLQEIADIFNAEGHKTARRRR
jgi:DNA invertase Pin-like site-specific DNA recombinase